MNLASTDNIVCFVDNVISSTLVRNAQIFESCKEYSEYFSKIENLKLNGKILYDLKKDIDYLKDIEFSRNLLILYSRQTKQIVKEYVKILRTPTPETAREHSEKIKKKLVNQYLDIVASCVPYKIFKNISINTDDKNIDSHIDNYCENCENISEFIKDNDVQICKNCFSEIIKIVYTNNRTHSLTISKCNYDRTTHFKECLKQFQGKQNTFINPILYDDLEKALQINGIIPPSTPDHNRTERYKNVTKKHIMYFLKELGYSKHYDDYILIHYNLTGQKPKDISHLEDILIRDFQQISEQYSLLFSFSDRKNFINIQYILYKLLKRHNFPFDPQDFDSMKSIDTKTDRDKIYKQITTQLGWSDN